MSSWRPRLVVRKGKRGSVASPRSTAGFAVWLIIGLFGTASIGLAATRVPWGLVLLVVTFWPIRDSIAWFTAPEEEREAFLAKIAQLEASTAGQRR